MRLFPAFVVVMLFSTTSKASVCDNIIPLEELKSHSYENEETQVSQYWSEVFSNSPTNSQWSLSESPGLLKQQIALEHGECYLNGSSNLSPDINKAIQYLEYAAELGSDNGANILAQLRLYYSKDYAIQKLGFEYLFEQYEAGSSFSAGKLAEAYQLGLGTEKDLREALRLYNIAAEAGNTYWQYLLAHAYREGYLGLPKSTDKYTFWRDYQPKIHLLTYECEVLNFYKRGIFPSGFWKEMI